MRSLKTDAATGFGLEVDDRSFLLVGETVGVHGIRGEIRVRLFNPGSASLTGTDEVVLLSADRRREAAAPRRFRVRGVRPHGGVWLLHLERIGTRNEAEAWVGARVAVPQDCLEPPGDDEYYWYQLVGLEVIDENRGVLGNVRNLITAEGNDVLEICGAAGEVLVPMNVDVIRKVDLDEGIIRIRLPEGLIDL